MHHFLENMWRNEKKSKYVFFGNGQNRNISLSYTSSVLYMNGPVKLQYPLSCRSFVVILFCQILY